MIQAVDRTRFHYRRDPWLASNSQGTTDLGDSKVIELDVDLAIYMTKVRFTDVSKCTSSVPLSLSRYALT